MGATAVIFANFHGSLLHQKNSRRKKPKTQLTLPVVQLKDQIT